LKPTKSDITPRVPLDPDRIVDAALTVAARDGFEKLSMRAIGQELGVEAMSLYHWFPSKAHLLDGLLDHFVREFEIPPSGSPAERLRGSARSFRAAARRHAALFGWLARHRMNTAVGLAALERLLAIFHDAGLDDAGTAAAFRLYAHWLVGYCLDETQGFTQGPSAASPPPMADVVAHHPYVVRLGPYNQPAHHDALFEWALDRVIVAILGGSSAGTK
jgi:AcrR family transcriptional regulator